MIKEILPNLIETIRRLSQYFDDITEHCINLDVELDRFADLLVELQEELKDD